MIYAMHANAGGRGYIRGISVGGLLEGGTSLRSYIKVMGIKVEPGKLRRLRCCGLISLRPEYDSHSLQALKSCLVQKVNVPFICKGGVIFFFIEISRNCNTSNSLSTYPPTQPTLQSLGYGSINLPSSRTSLSNNISITSRLTCFFFLSFSCYFLKGKMCLP